MVPRGNRSPLRLLLCALITCIAVVKAGDCNAHVPAFPLPQLDPKSDILQKARSEIESSLRRAIAEADYNTTSVSIAVTSSKETLFEFHHTARDRNSDRPGAKIINGDTCYRIASCTKAFTVLALLQQQKAGKINLDDPVNKYIAELNAPQNGSLPWKDITIRTLASQLSGIPRDYGQSDLLSELENPTSYGLPPLAPSDHHEAQCDEITNYTKPCTKADLLKRVMNAEPLFAPKQQSTYSNLNYELLALVLQNVTSTPYEDLIRTDILDKLNMTSSSFSRPPDSVAALPKGISYYWDVVMGMQNPTGGLYSSTTDLVKFIRYVLTSYNGLTPALNWIHPVSFSTGINSFYGMPWEIFRTDKVFPYTKRPVTLITKGGGLPGYSSIIVSVPDYDLGFAILVAGNGLFLSKALQTVALNTIRAAETIAQANLKTKYTGTWSALDSENINSTITLAHSLPRGLYIESWVSNGTDILGELGTVMFSGTASTWGRSQYLQLVPTLLFKDEKNQKGEIWRIIGHRTASNGKDPVDEDVFAGLGSSTGDSLCDTDIDIGAYGGLPINEVSFWDEKEDGSSFGALDLTGFRIRLEKYEKSAGSHGGLEDLMVQQEL